MSLDDKQKAWLIAEGKKWVEQGLILPRTINNILKHYGITETIAPPARPQKAKDPKVLIKTVLFIGATLISLGIILFIAANWHKIPPSLKIAGTALLTLSFLHTGYRFQFRTAPKINFARAFFFLAASGIGATLLLIGQIYHVQTDAYMLPLLWGSLILPIALFMNFPAMLIYSGALWLISHLLYSDSHQTFLWLYPLIVLGVQLPISIKSERKYLLPFSLVCILISSFQATSLNAHWANLLYGMSCLALSVWLRQQILQILAMFILALWNISFIGAYETVPNVFYVVVLVYFFVTAWKTNSPPIMGFNTANTLFWIFTFFYQIRVRFNLTGPEGTDVLLFLTAVCLFIYSLSEMIREHATWHSLTKFYKIGSLTLGLFLIYNLSFRFYTEQQYLINSPMYFGGIIIAAGVGFIALFPMLLRKLQSDPQSWYELLCFSLTAGALAAAFILPPNHFLHVLLYNLILFLGAFTLMLTGYRKKMVAIYNGGVALFVISIFTRYFDSLWRLLPRSVFFILGGVFLMLWAFFIDKKRREITARSKN
ncbi:MAG: DUF2157 domain-containing protein [bacterium]